MIFNWTPRHAYRDGELAIVWTTGGSSIVAPAKGLFGAIRERMEGTSAIMDLLVGGANGAIYQDIADEDAWDNPPFAVLAHVGGDRDDTTGLRWLQRDLCQVTFYGTDHDTLDQLGEAWEDAFNRGMTPLSVRRRDDGVTVVNRPPRFLGDSGKTKSGLVLTMMVIEFVAFGAQDLR